MGRTRWGALGAGLLLALVASACGGPEAPESKPVPGATHVKGAGATFPSLLYRRWIEVYEREHPGIVIDYDAVGSGEGERRFLAGEVDFGASDAALPRLADEQILAPDGGVVLVPTTAGSIVLVHNLPGLDGELRLSRQNYVDIFLGRITDWQDDRIRATNPGRTIPDLPIAVVVRLDESGTTYAFTKHLSAVGRDWADGPGTGKLIDWPGTAMTARGNGGVAALVKRTPGAIGYVEYGFSLEIDLARAALENRAGMYVSPTGTSGSRTIANANLPPSLRAFFPDPDGQDSYPIVTMTWLLLRTRYEGEKADALRMFVAWCLGAGQRHCEEMGYLRLPDGVLAQARDALRRVGP